MSSEQAEDTHRIRRSPVWLRGIVAVAAFAVLSPAPWFLLGSSTDARVALPVIGMGCAVAAAAAAWALQSWSRVAIAGALLNLPWFYGAFVDPESGPWLGLFQAAPYLTFTVAGVIGCVRESSSVRRWAGVVVPPFAYALPLVAAGLIQAVR